MGQSWTIQTSFIIVLMMKQQLEDVSRCSIGNTRPCKLICLDPALHLKPAGFICWVTAHWFAWNNDHVKGKSCHSAATKGKHRRAYLRSPASFGKKELNGPPEVSSSWHGLVLRAWANKRGPTVWSVSPPAPHGPQLGQIIENIASMRQMLPNTGAAWSGVN